jgi:hypothetical protein
LNFCFSTFFGVSREGEFKNTIKTFLQKFHVENKLKSFDNNFDVSFSSSSFVLSSFRVVSSDGSSKTLQKRFYKNNRVEKFLQKVRPKIPNRLFLDFFSHVFGRFSMRGVKKHDKKDRKNKSDPGPFSYSDPPTHHGGHRFFFWRPHGAPCPLAAAWPNCELPAGALFLAPRASPVV